MNKDLFFFSNYCDHCKDVINIMNKKNIRSTFLFVCVDNSKYQIPKCITHVPTVMTKNREIVTDKDIIKFLDMLSTTSSHTGVPSELAPYSLLDGNGYSSSYTWLTENGYDNDGGQQENKFFVSIGNEGQSFLHQKEETSTKGIKFDDKMYENFLASRNTDDEQIKRTLNSGDQNFNRIV